MKKNSTSSKSPKQEQKTGKGRLTFGRIRVNRTSRYCILDGDGGVVNQGSLGSTNAALKQTFGQIKKCRIAPQAGAHSPSVSRSLKAMGHEVIMANPRQLKLISGSSRKDDRVDAEMLAGPARVDLKLPRPIRHRGEAALMDLMAVRGRAGGIGGSAHQSGERSARVQKNQRRAAGGVRCRSDGNGESVGAAGGITGSITSAAGAGGRVNGGHQRGRPETGARSQRINILGPHC
jgi:hypothetical protein